MALNQLLYQHQIAKARAWTAGPGGVRDAHCASAKTYATRIRAMRAELGGTIVGALRVT